MRVPLVDLKAQYLSIKDEVDQAVARVLESGNYVMGQEVESFEEEWAEYCGRAKYCVGVSSGTDALYLTLKALPEVFTDVLTTPLTFFATTQAIIQAGKRPKFVDVECDGNIDLMKHPQTSTALVVHMYGQPVYVPSNYPSSIIEDSAQAHGIPLKGTAACYSFYPTKNLSAVGQAGAVVTNDKDLADTIRELRTYGERERFVHYSLTGNHRMDELQAAILRAKLPHLSQWTMLRQSIAGAYDEQLEGLLGISLIPRSPEHVCHIYGILMASTDKRASLVSYLNDLGVSTGIRYPVPMHLQPALSFLGYKKGDFPVAEGWADTVLNLPIYPEMSMEAVSYVTESVKEWAIKEAGLK